MLSEPETALSAQGAISVSRSGGWRLGWLSLGETTLTFRQPGRPGMRIDLETVTRLDVERRTFVMCAKRVVRLAYRPTTSAHPRSCWLITAHLGDWEAALSRRAGLPSEHRSTVGPTLPVTRELATALAELGGTAGLILDYLAHRGHATTGELMALVGAGTEEAVFLHLHERFRPVRTSPGPPGDPVRSRVLRPAVGGSEAAVVAARRVGSAMVAGLPRSGGCAARRGRPAGGDQRANAGAGRAARRPSRTGRIWPRGERRRRARPLDQPAGASRWRGSVRY